MKSRNAFAFRDFDGARILRRPFFKNFYFDFNKSDEEILESLKAADSDSIDDMEEKLHTIKATHDRLENYRRLLNKHTRRCDRYNKRKAEALEIKVSEIFSQRHAPTMEYVSAELECLELMEKFRRLYYDLEKQIQERYRREFAARLKQARLKAGLKQKELGELIQISPNGYSQYESGRREPSLPTLSRLLKIFTAEELFGRIKK